MRQLLVLALLLSASHIRAEEKMVDRRAKLLHLFAGEWVSRGLYVATKLSIADHLASGPKSTEELGGLCKADPDALYRMLHMLVGHGVFTEGDHQTFANNPTSLLLTKSHPDSLHSLGVFYGEDMHKAWESLLAGIHSGKTPFTLEYHEPVFSYFKNHPDRAALFQAAMKQKTRSVAQSALTSFDFSHFSHVFDIGGGYGHFLQELVSKYPKVKGTLFDLPEVIAKAPIDPRLEYIAGDFSHLVPEGGDLYILKSILHKWCEEECVTILKNCRKVMNDKTRLLIVEVVVLPGSQSVYANNMDLFMFVITGGRERTLESFESMFSKAGLTLEKVHPTATEFALLEVKKRRS